MKTLLTLTLFFSALFAQAEVSPADLEKAAEFGSSLRAVRAIDLYPIVMNDFIEENPTRPRLQYSEVCMEIGKVEAQLNMLGGAWGRGDFQLDYENDEAWILSLNISAGIRQLQSELGYLTGYCNSRRKPENSVGYQNAAGFAQGFVKWTENFLNFILTLQYDLQGKYRLESVEEIMEYWRE